MRGCLTGSCKGLLLMITFFLVFCVLLDSRDCAKRIFI